MSFRKATDELMRGVTVEEIADGLDVSFDAVRQARLSESAKAHRNPPPGWQKGLAKLARQRAEHFRKLAEKLSKNGNGA